MISIITSLYKSERHLPSFLKRIKKMATYLEKKGVAYEFIILPNSANNKEKTLLKQPIRNVKIIERNLETIYATWNVGIKNAIYKNICFWNVDDIRFGKSIITGIRDLKNDADIIYFPFIYLRFLKIWKIKLLAKVRIFYPPSFDKKKFSKEMHCGPFFMTTKNAFNKVGLFNEKYTVAGDFEWCVRATMAGLTFKRNQTMAGIFTSDGTTLSGSQSLEHKAEGKEIIDTYK